MKRQLSVAVERFPIAGTFTIARGSRIEAIVVTATIRQGDAVGRGECVPYPRYGETVEGVAELVASLAGPLADGLDRAALQEALPPGAARNALDCALWDLDAKLTGVPAHVAAGFDRLLPATTAYTISLGDPAAMAEAARRAAARPILKVKLGAPDGDEDRMEAVRAAAPDAVLLADANEGWTEANLDRHLSACRRHGFALVEQPLPAVADAALSGISRAVSLCADESLHDRAGLSALAGRYDAINVKLDKTGGLTEALLLVAEAQRLGLGVMVGCMVGTSLAMAPALLLASRAQFVDLDGPLLLARDREDGLRYDGGTIYPPSPSLWG